jgi:hypothetical protein
MPTAVVHSPASLRGSWHLPAVWRARCMHNPTLSKTLEVPKWSVQSPLNHNVMDSEIQWHRHSYSSKTQPCTPSPYASAIHYIDAWILEQD